MCDCAKVAYINSSTETMLDMKECRDIAEKHVPKGKSLFPAVKAIREALAIARGRIERLGSIPNNDNQSE